MHTVELLYYILLSCFYDRPEDGIYPSDIVEKHFCVYGHCLISTISSVSGNDDGSREHSHDFLRSICGFLCLCRDMAHDTFSYEYPSYRIFFIRCLVGMLECTSHWYIFYSSYPARLSASSLTLQRAYDNMLNGMHTIPMIRIHTIDSLLSLYQ